MYSSGYSQVSKRSMQGQKRMQYHSKGKSCGYYMRIVFFFSSLIQSLIIVSLVLFLVYGKKQDSPSTARIQDLEESFSRLSIENVALRQQRKNLTNLLNTTLTNKARNDWDLAKIRYYTNISSVMIQDYERRMQQCANDLYMCKATCPGCTAVHTPMMTTIDNCNCGPLFDQMKAKLELVESNFTQKVQKMRMEAEQITKERDYINLEAIHLRRDKSNLQNELELYKKKTKDEFSQSLSGVANVSKAFIQKIESLFPSHIPFQLTCLKQREHLEQIRTNCTSLSREVEDKLQGYLNIVGDQVSEIQAENNHLKAENMRLSEDYRSCTQNRSGIIQEYKQKLDNLQRKHDQEKEKLLVDKMKLNGEIDVLDSNVKYKTKEVVHLKEQIKHLNMSYILKPGFGTPTRAGGSSQPGWGLFGGGGSASSSSTGVGQLGRPASGGLGSSYGSSGSAFNRAGSSFLSPGSSLSLDSAGSAFNKQGSTRLGSSSSSFFSPGSSSSLGSAGSAFNKQGSAGLGSSSSSFSSPGSSSSLGSAGSAFNKLGSTGLGSSSSSFSSPGSSSSLGSAGSAFNKLGSTGLGSSSSSFSSPGSSSSLGSAGSAFNKQGSTGTGSSSSSFSSLGSSSSLGSAGSALNKLGTTGGGLSSFGSAGSSPSLSSSGIGANKPALSPKGSSTIGLSSGSAGSSPSLSSSGIGSNKPTSSVKSSTGSTSKTGSTNSGFSWLGFGSSNSGQSKTGGGPAKGPSSGNSFGGTGSLFGAGRSSGLGGGSVNVIQHLQELQRIINPPVPEEKQELSRMLG